MGMEICFSPKKTDEEVRLLRKRGAIEQQLTKWMDIRTEDSY